jgi:hypothetical protein
MEILLSSASIAISFALNSWVFTATLIALSLCALRQCREMPVEFFQSLRPRRYEAQRAASRPEKSIYIGIATITPA